MRNNITKTSKAEIFHFQGKPIRVVPTKGEPWFVAADVCKALEIVNPRTAIKCLEQSERDVQPFYTRGGNQNLNIISESGLYKLIMRSDKPQAKPFQNWVTQVVLPAIRRDGGYIKDEEKVATGEMSEDEFILKAMTMLKMKSERLEAVVEEHLKNLTVNEWAALHHLYLSKGQRVRLGEAASFLSRQAGHEPCQQKQHIPSFGRDIEIRVGVYPKHILDEAAPLVGIQSVYSINLGVAA